MSVEPDILRTANLWLVRHGDSAVAEARRQVAALQSAGRRDDADIWLRVMLAVETLSAPPAGTR